MAGRWQRTEAVRLEQRDVALVQRTELLVLLLLIGVVGLDGCRHEAAWERWGARVRSARE